MAVVPAAPREKGLGDLDLGSPSCTEIINFLEPSKRECSLNISSILMLLHRGLVLSFYKFIQEKQILIVMSLHEGTDVPTERSRSEQAAGSTDDSKIGFSTVEFWSSLVCPAALLAFSQHNQRKALV